MAGKVKLTLLGGFRLVGPDNTPLTIKLRKSEALLAYLACQGASAVTRENTANLLWGDFDQQRARQSLRQAVLDIKKTFEHEGDVPIEMGRETISLRQDRVDVDVAHFERLVRDGSINALKEACDLYKGEFLFGFSVRASDFDGWLIAMRNRYLEMFCRASLQYMEQVSGSSPSLGIEVGQRAFRQDMLREDILRALMRLYAKAGRRAAALECYQECARYLERELATTPDDETKALFDELNGEKSTQTIGHVVNIEGNPIVSDVASNDVGFPLIGREKELAELRGHMADLARGLGRLLFLIGEKGVGKSQLLTTIAEDPRQRAIKIDVSRDNSGLSSFWDDLKKALRVEQDLIIAASPDARDSMGHNRLESGMIGENFSAPQPEELGHSPTRTSRSEITDLLRDQARLRPLTIAIDGLQNLDQADLSEFLLWAKRVCNYPILLAVAWPKGDAGLAFEQKQAVDTASSQEHASVMTLMALSNENISDLCDEFTSRLDFKTLSLSDKDWVWRVSQGNPKAAFTILLDWTEGVKAGPLAERPLPKAFNEEIEARLAGLSDKDRDFVSLVAIAGSITPIDVIELASGLALDEFAHITEKLINLNIFLSAESVLDRCQVFGRPAERGLQFQYEPIRLSLVSSLRPEKKRSIHKAIANSYLVLKGRRKSVFAKEIGAHFAGAGERFAAMEFALAGANFDIRRGDYKVAEVCFGDLLEELQKNSPETGIEKNKLENKIRLGLARIAELHQEFSNVVSMTGNVNSSALSFQDRSALEIIRARALFALGDRDSALRTVRRAESKSINGRAGDAWLLPDIILGAPPMWHPDYYDLEARLGKELNEARAYALVHDQVEIAGSLLLLLVWQRKFEEAREILREIGSTLSAEKHARFQALTLFLNGIFELYAGNADLAEHLLQQAESAASACGDLFRFYLALGFRAMALKRLGLVDDARETLTRCSSLAENFDCPPMHASFLVEERTSENEQVGIEVVLQSAKENDFWALSDPHGEKSDLPSEIKICAREDNLK